MKNIPNILSVIRICLVPVFVGVYFSEEGSDMRLGAALVYAVASLTDMLDGYLARRNNWISNLGRILDPLGDKLMVCAVITCITLDHRIHPVALVLFVAKELLMLAGGIVISKKFKMDMPPSNILGKLSTVLFFLVCATVLLFPGIPQVFIDALITLALVVTFAALGGYIVTFKNVTQKRKQTNIKSEK